MRRRLFWIISTVFCLNVLAQELPLSQQMANTVIALWPDSCAVKEGKPASWNYEQGVMLEGFEGVWKASDDAKYFNYIKKSIDFYVKPNGDIPTYKKGEYNIDHVKCGRSAIFLYKITGDLKYYKAAKLLRSQLKSHPRTSEGSFWHKNIYPHQVWLDGLYMAQPFYADYAATFNEPAAFDDIANQLLLIEKHTRDAKTGLLYHGWDESKGMKWANDVTGCSPNFWGRSVGWYAMALVDVMDNFPTSHPKYDSLVNVVNRLAVALQKFQDPATGLWYQILDKPTGAGNYLESSASAMFVYAIAKSVRKGYLPESFTAVAQKGFEGMKSKFVEKRAEGQINFTGTVSVAGLGGNPYRDGSYEYYLREKVVSNDTKGIGAFLMAATEVEMFPTLTLGKGKTVLLDNYFNNETRTDSTGVIYPHHYVWNQDEQNGFSLFGYIFNKNGVKTTQSSLEPSAELLSKANMYIIVDPDNKKETPNPKFIEAKHVKLIADWVKKGGVLLLFANDTGHAELSGINQLSAKFGIHFNDQARNMVKGKDYPSGSVNIATGNEIFKNENKLYLKEIATLSVKKPAYTVVKEGNDVVMAVAKYGKGTVFAVGDPWLYNEYMDDRKISAKEYQNYKAADDLVKWAISKSSIKK
jgi:unsaturated rhamnogalacturonyl hydrolase